MADMVKYSNIIVNKNILDIRIGASCAATTKTFNVPFSQNLHNFVYIAGSSGSQLIAIYNGQHFATTVNLTISICKLKIFSN